LGEKGACAYPGMAQIFPVPPIISVMRKGTNFKFGRYIHRVHRSKSLLKIWQKRAALAYPGTSQIFKVFPIMSRTRKATNLKFGKYIQTVHANKRLLNLEVKGAWTYPGSAKM